MARIILYRSEKFPGSLHPVLVTLALRLPMQEKELTQSIEEEDTERTEERKEPNGVAATSLRTASFVARAGSGAREQFDVLFVKFLFVEVLLDFD